MIDNKAAFIKEFFQESVKTLEYTQISLDNTDLSLTDVIRNLNKLYRPNTRARDAIESGEMVVGVLCRSEYLEPYRGLFIFIGKDDLEINIVSQCFIVLYLSESRIRTEDDLTQLSDDITTLLIKNYSDQMSNFPEFYKRYVYNESELYDDYASDGY